MPGEKVVAAMEDVLRAAHCEMPQLERRMERAQRRAVPVAGRLPRHRLNASETASSQKGEVQASAGGERRGIPDLKKEAR